MIQTKIEKRLARILSPNSRRRGVTTTASLLALAGILVLAPLVSGVRLAPQMTQAQKAEQTETLKRLKVLAVASIMYGQDYDEKFPYVRSTSQAAQVLLPYVQESSAFDSPKKGGAFLFNLTLGGRAMISFSSPAETPLWAETLQTESSQFAVAYVDGHVKVGRPLVPKSPTKSPFKFQFVHFEVGSTEKWTLTRNGQTFMEFPDSRERGVDNSGNLVVPVSSAGVGSFTPPSKAGKGSG